MALKRTLVTLAVLLLAVTLWPLSIIAQETTGGIQGTVSDPSGAVVPQVAVTITNLGTLRVRSAKAGNDGSYRVQDLEPGRYSIAFEKSGFAKYLVPDLSLLVGRTVKVDATLEVGATRQTIMVAETAPLIDTSSTMVAHNVPSEEFNLLPKPRTFEGVAIFSTSVNTGELEGGYQINGASGAENNFYIDGVSTVSMLDGSARQTAVFDYLAEVQVKTAGLDAEYGGALGGVISAITKSGGSKFHGDVHYYYSGNALSASPTQRLEVNPANKYTLNPTLAYFQDRKNSRNLNEMGGSFGGPLIKHKLFLFASVSPRWLRQTNQYQFSDGAGSMSRKALTMSGFGRLDYVPTSRVRMNFSWLYTPQYVTGSLYGYDEFAPSASTATIADGQAVAHRGWYQPENSVSGTIDFTLSTTSLLSVKGGRYYLDYRETGSPATREYWWQGSSAGIAGIDPSLEHDAGYTTPASGNVDHDITTRTYVQADFSQYLHFGGQHQVKAGVGTTKNINNVADLWSGRDGRVNLYWGATGTASLPGVPVGQYGYYRVDFGGTNGTAGANITHLYIQDAWRIHPRLTLSLGVRAEKETIPSFRPDIQKYAFKFGFGDKLSPRIGASWDVLGNGKLKVSGFWGRFYDWTKMDLSRGTFGGDVWHMYFRTLDTLDINSIDLNNMPGTDMWNAAHPTSYFRDYRLPGFGYTDPAIKPMSTEMINAGLEWEIRPQMVFSARYVRNNLRRTIEDMGLLDAEGNTVYRYGNPGEGTNTATPASGASCPVTVGGVCAVPMPKAKRTYDAMELQLSRRFSRGWLANVSYVYSRLYGNYAGLASTDEYRPSTLGYGYGADQSFAAAGTRPGANINLAFDMDEILFTANGTQGVYGRLATDRPHVFKFYGAYNFKFGTEVGAFFRVMSGTPVSTQVDTSNWYPMLVEGRGDLGRTPTFSQTDLMVAHEFKLGEVKKLRFEFNMMNLFNQKTNMFTFPWYNYDEIVDSVGMNLSGVDLTQGFDWKATALAASNDAGSALDPRYKKPAAFNPGFGGRFMIKFLF